MTAAAEYFALPRLCECDFCGGDAELLDLHETLDGEFFCPDCVDIHAPQLVPARPVRTVYLPGDKPQK